MRVSSAQELRAALRAAWGLNRHSVVEVTTDRRTNVERHREVQRAAQRAASDALRVFSAAMVSAPTFAGCSREAARSFFLPVVAGAAYYRFALPLAKPLTAGAGDGGVRRGMRLQIWLTVGCLRVLGEGEVSPLPGLHAETLAQAEQQVAALCELLVGVTVPMSTALLGGRFAAWLARGVGVPAEGLLPSVRCGLEAALLSALASPAGGSLAKVLNAAAGGSCSSLPSRPALGPGGAAVNALLDCRGGPAAAAAEAESLVAAGFTTLKLKVARQADPLADAAAVLAVRQAVGPAVVLRADANQRWSLQEAVQFGAAAAPARLQYVEEPVAGGADGAAAFFLATGVHTALDESIDQGRLDTAQPLPAGVAALVLKPSSLGGFERALQLAAWARAAGAAAVISSAFESPAGLQQLGALAAAVDPEGVTHHGLATQDWFCEAAQIPELLGPKRSRSPRGVVLGQLIPRRVQLFGREAGTAAAAERRLEVSTAAGDFGFRLLEVSPPGSSSNNSDGNGKGSSTGSSTGISGNGAGAAASAPRPAVVFLHGFLGSADEWAPHMHALASSGRRCVALDLPGHGATTTTMGAAAASGCSLPAAAEAVAALLQRAGLQGCTLVGYSLGARLALAVAARRPELAGRVVAVSGTPGIEAAGPRAARAARDDGVAESLRRGGVQAFVRRWYQQPMWASLRAHPRFASVAAARARQPGGAAALGAALSAMSPGRAPAVWAELEAAAAAGSLPPLLLVAGALDPKFVGVAERLEAALNARRAGAAHAATLPGCGHAAHLERPLELLRLLADFV
jgi:isochorismate synthase/2-succinyl-5-enolpyruvyl-6-hydroxy-3-cyclohexene-1-carboxylate synthase/2-succinyl-6-hydroxy-2,4-cyclohexadiene-1-carboxylate synthase/O-succinylbenzoate synthase